MEAKNGKNGDQAGAERGSERERERVGVCVCVCEEMHRRAKERTGTSTRLASRARTSTTGRVADPPAGCLDGGGRGRECVCYPAPLLRKDRESASLCV